MEVKIPVGYKQDSNKEGHQNQILNLGIDTKKNRVHSNNEDLNVEGDIAQEDIDCDNTK